jgi:hypothetical protein
VQNHHQEIIIKKSSSGTSYHALIITRYFSGASAHG